MPYMADPIVEAVQTRRVYAFMQTVYTNQYATTRRTGRQLRSMLERAYEGRRMPELRLVTCETSYYQPGDHIIALASHQRDYHTLLHEIVHAEGKRYWNHGPAFMRRYINKLVRFARCDEGYLILSALIFGVKL